MSVKNSDIQTDYVINVSGSIPVPAGTFAPFTHETQQMLVV